MRIKKKKRKTNYDGDPNAYYLDVPFADAVPVPAAVWLLSSGLLGMIGIRKKMRA